MNWSKCEFERKKKILFKGIESLTNQIGTLVEVTVGSTEYSGLCHVCGAIFVMSSIIQNKAILRRELILKHHSH